MKNIDASKFKELVFNFEKHEEWKFEGDRPCIVDFYADWCGPCKALAPLLQELSEEYEDVLDIYKVDIQAEQELANVFDIRSIPTMLFIPVEGPATGTAGALPEEQLRIKIEELIND